MTPNALLLVGPTGSGKTPLGERIASEGLWGRRWAHFDFGAQMRRAVAERQTNGLLTAADLDLLADVLHRGALLEDHQFPLAARIFQAFLASCSVGADTWIVLNGLPRHVGQAAAMDSLATVRAVVELACPAEEIPLRIGKNVGGDRTGRPDDQPETIRRKLKLYAQRTAPLVAHYRQRSVPLVQIQVARQTTDVAMLQALESQSPFSKPPPCSGCVSTRFTGKAGEMGGV
jgi:adenylate kinase